MKIRGCWAQLMVDVERFESPYHDCAQAGSLFRRLLLESGFRRADVTARRKEYRFEFDVFKKVMRAVSPFTHRLDPTQQERLVDDLLDVLIKNELVQIINNNEGETVTIGYEYTLIVAQAAK